MQPRCLKLRSQLIAAAREDDSEEIIENIEGNLKEDAKSGASEEGEIPLAILDNLKRLSTSGDISGGNLCHMT